MAVGEHAQQAGLQFGRHVADFVEKQGATVGLLETAAAQRGGTGECTTLMAEEFGLEQVARDGGGVDGDEGRVAAWAVAVQGKRHKLLASAGFAVDEHRGMRVCKAANGAEQHLHGGGLAEDLGREHGLCRRRVLLQTLRKRASDERKRLIDIKGLGQVFESATLKARHCAVEVRKRGHDDDRQLGMAQLHLLQQLQARRARHADVG